MGQRVRSKSLSNSWKSYLSLPSPSIAIVLGLSVALTMTTLFLLRKRIPSAYWPSQIGSNWNPLSTSSTTQLLGRAVAIADSRLTSLLTWSISLIQEGLGLVSVSSLCFSSSSLSSATILALQAHPFHDPSSAVCIG